MGEIVVVGAGIIGLWTALLLAEQGRAQDIVVIAKNLPGDLSIEYTSPIAGAHFSCAIAGFDKRATRWNRLSYPMLKKVFKKFEGSHEQAGLARFKQIELFAEQIDPAIVEDVRSYADDFEVITDKAYLNDHGAVSGMTYLTYNFYTPKLLKFLKHHLETQGAKFVRGSLGHITEAPRAAGVPGAKVVFNCTGVLATQLGGVRDSQATYPIRGQVLEVRAPWVRDNIGINTSPPTYIIPRPHSNGRVILGGFYDKGDWTEGTHVEKTESILARTTKLYPELLKNGPLEILDQRAGLRPGRDTGARIEREAIGGLVVIHNYGAAGTGYQSGLAMSQDAIDLLLKPEAKL